MGIHSHKIFFQFITTTIRTSALFLTAFTFFLPLGHGFIVEKVLAIVGDEYITLTEFNSYKKKLSAGSPLLEQSVLKTRNKSQLLAEDKALLEHMIDEKVLDFVVKANDSEAKIEDIEKQIYSIASKNGANIEGLERSLQTQGVSIDEYRNFIKQSLERPNFIQSHIFSKIEISDFAISYEYSKNKPDKLSSYKIALNKLTFSSKKEALKAYKQIKKIGFQDYVKTTKKENPFWSTFFSQDMNAELSKKVIFLNQGEFTEPLDLEGNGKFSILHVKQKTTLNIVDTLHDGEKNKLRSQIFSQISKKTLQNWLKKQRSTVLIRVN